MKWHDKQRRHNILKTKHTTACISGNSPFVIGTYEYCTFKNSDFSGADLSHTLFVECVFLNCNLSLAKLENTVFRDSKFRDCKMLGLRFDTCNEFGLSFSFENCTLNHSSFYKTKIKKTILQEHATAGSGFHRL
jgi:uncharacterized protein YjbI with pentapeptide repeats